MILYFSGTGNSRHVAFELSKRVGDEETADMGDMLKTGKT